MCDPTSRFLIRPYRASDARCLARLYFNSVRQLGSRRYSQQQVAAWAPAPVEPDAVHARASDGRTTLVAVDARGEVLGYCDLEADGHIDHLYCSPGVAGSGVAGALVHALLERADEAGLSRLYVEASELACGLLRRKGFTVIARSDFELSGVAIHNYAMEWVR